MSHIVIGFGRQGALGGKTCEGNASPLHERGVNIVVMGLYKSK